jgi:Zn-dependent peptidase ImmA (M78 family)
VLLLSVPPQDFDPIRDFRTGIAGARPDWSAELVSELRRAQSQREVLLELAEIAPAAITETRELPAVLVGGNADNAAEEVRTALGFEPGQSWDSSYEALNYLASAVERLGILVIHTREVSVSEMRGFSVSEWPFPAIALNGSDAPRARLFTLAHELVHLALNASGLCDLHESGSTHRTTEDAVEHFCNRTAAALFMPSEMLLADPTVAQTPKGHAWTLDELAMLSRRFGPSREAALLRLLSLGRADWELYWSRKDELDREAEQARSLERLRRKESPGGPSYYVVKARDLGHGYVTSVLDAFRSRAISSLDVSDYLEVRFSQLPRLEQVLR